MIIGAVQKPIERDIDFFDQIASGTCIGIPPGIASSKFQLARDQIVTGLDIPPSTIAELSRSKDGTRSACASGLQTGKPSVMSGDVSEPVFSLCRKSPVLE